MTPPSTSESPRCISPPYPASCLPQSPLNMSRARRALYGNMAQVPQLVTSPLRRCASLRVAPASVYGDGTALVHPSTSSAYADAPTAPRCAYTHPQPECAGAKRIDEPVDDKQQMICGGSIFTRRVCPSTCCLCAETASPRLNTRNLRYSFLAQCAAPSTIPPFCLRTTISSFTSHWLCSTTVPCLVPAASRVVDDNRGTFSRRHDREVNTPTNGEIISLRLGCRVWVCGCAIKGEDSGMELGTVAMYSREGPAKLSGASLPVSIS
ncbi:hypothetical protein AB1N83_008520 [Pleurotus pulmonarius]